VPHLINSSRATPTCAAAGFCYAIVLSPRAKSIYFSRAVGALGVAVGRWTWDAGMWIAGSMSQAVELGEGAHSERGGGFGQIEIRRRGKMPDGRIRCILDARA